MKLNIYFLFGALGIVFIIVPLVLSKLLKSTGWLLKLSMALILVDYLFVLALLTLLNVKFSYPSLIISWENTGSWFSMNFEVWGDGLFNYISNLSMFLPLGIFVFNLRDKKRYRSTIIAAFVISTLIELLQFVLPTSRTTELADIVLGTLSGLISATFCKIFYSIKK